MRQPSFQFYPADWLNDINLKMATYEEKGFLIDLMCLLHQSKKYGYLSKEIEAKLPQLLGKDRRTSTRLLAKVQQKSLMKRDSKTGELFNERMVKDERIRCIRKAAGALGGNPNLVKQEVKQGSKQNLTPSSSPSSSSSSSVVVVEADEKIIDDVFKALQLKNKNLKSGIKDVIEKKKDPVDPVHVANKILSRYSGAPDDKKYIAFCNWMESERPKDNDDEKIII